MPEPIHDVSVPEIPPLRRAILTLLTRAPARERELASTLRLTQPLVAHHLRMLRGAGLVEVHRVGRNATYFATDPTHRTANRPHQAPTNPSGGISGRPIAVVGTGSVPR